MGRQPERAAGLETGAAPRRAAGGPGGAGRRRKKLSALARYAAARPATRRLSADEAWWGLTTERGRVWTRGERPVPRVSGGRSWAPVMAAVEPATGRLHSLIAGRFEARWFGYSLAQVAAAYPGGRAILVVDNAGRHKARALAVPADIILWFLPPHSPALNPAEQLWQWLREQHTRGVLFRTRAALLDALCRGLTELMDAPGRVRSLTARAMAPAADARIPASVSIKCYRADGRRRDEHEWRALTLLAERGCDFAPRPLRHDPHSEAPIVATDYLPGEGLGGRELDREQLAALADRLTFLFTVTPAVVVGPVGPVAGPPASILRRAAAALAPEAGSRAGGVFDEASALWRRWQDREDAALLLEPAPAVFAHGDGNLANCLWDGRAGRLGLVDFEYSGWSDRATEMAVWVEHVGSRGTPDAEWDWFAARFDLSPAERRRYEAARRLFALFWISLLTDRPELLARQVARARRLLDHS